MIEFFELLLYGLVFYITTQLDDEANDKVISVLLMEAVYFYLRIRIYHYY